MVRARTSMACLPCIWLLGAGLSACTSQDPPPDQPRAVRIIKADPREQFLSTETTGQIAARYTSNVGFMISGRLVTRAVDVGATVKAGDLLARIDPTDFQNRLEAAQAQVVSAQADVDQATPQEERLRKLLADGFTTKADYDQAMRSLQTARAGLGGAQASLRLAQDQLKYAQLVAPDPGIVTQTGADPGQVLQAGQMVVQLSRLDEREAVFAVSPELVAHAHPGLAVKVWMQGDSSAVVSGKIREVAPNADTATGTYTVKVALPDAPASFRLGAIVTGRADVAGAVMTRLPAGALLQTGDKPQVWLVSMPASTVRKQPVTVFRYDSDTILVSAGLSKGDLVVAAGVNSLAEGQKVALQESAAP